MSCNFCDECSIHSPYYLTRCPVCEDFLCYFCYDVHTHTKGACPGDPTMAPEPKISRSNAARKGGLTISKNRAHMAAIGRRGGMITSRDREHMAKIGRKGGGFRGIKKPSGPPPDSL